jgi:hypothetical protein
VAYKQFVAGEEALAADVNSYLMSQTVARFANASARTAAITAPALNQLSSLDTNKGAIDYWNGSAWVPLGISYERYWSGVGPAIIGVTQVDLTMVSFTMPVTGLIILQGMVRIDAAASQPASPITAYVIASGGSTPAPTVSAPSAAMANANVFGATLPFGAKWSAVNAGTAVTIKGGLYTSAAQVTFNWWMGTVRIIPAEF